MALSTRIDSFALKHSDVRFAGLCGIARAYDTLYTYMGTLHNYTERSKLVKMLRRDCQKMRGTEEGSGIIEKKCKF